jgi:hypothetical protein
MRTPAVPRYVRDRVLACSGARTKTAAQTVADLDVVWKPFELTSLDFNAGVMELAREKTPVRPFHLLIGLARTRPVWTNHHPGRVFYLSQTSPCDCSAAGPASVIEQDEPLAVCERRVEMGPCRMPARVPVV